MNRQTAPAQGWYCLVVVVVAMVACVAGCGKTPSRTPASEAGQPAAAAEVAPPLKSSAPWFQDFAGTTGLTFHHSSGHDTRFWMPEIETGGVGLLDVDGDGLLDVFCVNGGNLNKRPAISGHRLYRNLGGFRFEDITDRAGVAGVGGDGMGVACADYDNDGDTDILVTQVEGCLLYRNEGRGRFLDVTLAAGLERTGWGTSAAFVDLDQDGYLDLFVVNYLNWSQAIEVNCRSSGGRPDYCSPLNYRGAAVDSVWRNRGDGTFERMTERVFLNRAYGHGLGVATADFDRDGRVDVYVANDATPNQLWLNQGNWVFRDEALMRGAALNLHGVPRAGMGVVAVDLRQHGWFDIYLTHLVNEGNGVFLNAQGNFIDTVLPDGPQRGSIPMTGFGVGFHDFDCDGSLDLYVANGRVRLGSRDLDPMDPYAEPNSLLRGLGEGKFEVVNPSGGTTNLLVATSRAAAFGDLDNDGAIDVVVINKDGPVHLLRNVLGRRAQSVQFRVLSREGRDALNAVVRLETQSGAPQWRQVAPNEGYCASHDPRIHFGIGSATRIERVCVRWPSAGPAEVFGPFEAGAVYEIRQGRGRTSPMLFEW